MRLFNTWETIKILLKAARSPAILLCCTAFFYILTSYLLRPLLGSVFSYNKYRMLFDLIVVALILMATFWFFYNVINLARRKIEIIAEQRQSKVLLVTIPVVDNSLKAILFISLITFFAKYLHLPQEYQVILEKVISIIIILTIANMIIKIISGYEAWVIRFYQPSETNWHTREIYTQVHLLKRILIIIVSLLTVAACLVLFESAREIGKNIFLTAGVLGAIIAFSAQRTLANIIACLQLAFTQPVRIGDTISFEGEFGTVEEITLVYMVIQIWDLRRLIVPLSYFFEKPFQSFTRQSTNLLCSVFIYVDYTVSINALREEFSKILKDSFYWDKKVQALHVTDVKSNMIEVRLLTSAPSPEAAWELKCEVREKMVNFITRNYPSALPRVRQETAYSKTDLSSSSADDKHYEKI